MTCPQRIHTRERSLRLAVLPRTHVHQALVVQIRIQHHVELRRRLVVRFLADDSSNPSTH